MKYRISFKFSYVDQTAYTKYQEYIKGLYQDYIKVNFMTDEHDANSVWCYVSGLSSDCLTMVTKQGINILSFGVSVL